MSISLTSLILWFIVTFAVGLLLGGALERQEKSAGVHVGFVLLVFVLFVALGRVLP